MANLANCHVCGMRERPYEMTRGVCVSCFEDIAEMFDHPLSAEAYLEEILARPAHWPNNITSEPMSLEELEAWGYDAEMFTERP